MIKAADAERVAAVRAAQTLRDADFPCTVVSVGSTPTAQEHGIVALRPGSNAMLPELAVGTQVRILPNHACATGAQHGSYHVLGHDGLVQGEWRRFSGW